MPSTQETVDFILEQMSEAGTVTAKKMFGEYGIYCNGKMVASVCDDQLFLNPTVAGRAFVDKVVESSPYPGAKPHLLISGDQWEDRQWLSELIRVTAEDLPTPAPKKPKKAKNAKAT